VLALLVALVILAIIVAFIAKPVLAGLGAPGWMYTVVVGIAIIVAIVLIANAFGIATPSLK
jgi:hypothetical protein